MSAEGIGKALEYFREMNLKAPDFALGLAWHAACLIMLGYWGHAPISEVYPSAKHLALQAVAIDDSLATAHLALSWMSLLISLRYQNYEPHTLGHNTLASLAYVLVFLVASFMGLTGFAMRGEHNPGGFLDTVFGWVIPILGGAGYVRMWHRLGMWLIVAFMIHHIVFVFYLEILREKGLVSSMISGIKMRPLNWKAVDKPWESPKS